MRTRPLTLVVAGGLIALFALIVSHTASGEPFATSYDDEFNSAQLNTKWSWIREDASRWSLTASPGSLRIITQYGDLYQGYNNMRNLLLQAMPDTDFDVTTKLKFNPVAEYHQAGVILYQDDDNYLKLVRAYDRPWGGADVVFALERGGSFDHSFHQAVPNSAENLYLKLSRKGTWYRGYYSTDGAAWVPLGEYSQVSFVSPKFGLIAANGYVTYAPEISADFDFFRVRLDSLYTITGRVTDASGRGIPGVTVWAGFPRNTTTDASGNYTFTDLPAGTCTIRPDKEPCTFSPATQTVTIPPGKVLPDFTSVRLASGLDVCILEPGDILLKAGAPVGDPSDLIRLWIKLGGSYFTHSALYLGVTNDPENPAQTGPRIAEAAGKKKLGGSREDEVSETWLADTQWWDGENVTDWAVVRPVASVEAKAIAIQYARDKAADPDVVFSFLTDLDDEQEFYCSKLVWKSYQRAGLDVHKKTGLTGNLTSNRVTPEDLYFGSPVVQNMPGVDPSARAFFRKYSPAHITLIDPLGRRTGFDSTTGGEVNEIPHALYSGADAQIESITVAGLGSPQGWRLLATGYALGPYTLETGYLDARTRNWVTRATTTEGKIDEYPVRPPDYPSYLPLLLR